LRPVLSAIETEYRRYELLGQGVLEQLGGEALCARPSAESNSIATLVWHVAGNLVSRFTDFLGSDGEKPWREREEEFAPRNVTGDELREKWAEGWSVLFDALGELSDDDLERTITIRGVELSVIEALLRSLAHTASHVGQMMYAGKLLAGAEWRYLSIPPGGTTA
jgi:hypothetical protein